MKKNVMISLLACAVFLLSGCSLLLEEPSTLITPPASNQAEYQERKIINTLLAADEYLEVPETMNDPSAYVKVDINHDGNDEKLVFWIKSNGYETGATLIGQTEGIGWTVFDRVALSGRSVDYFKLFDFDRDGNKEALIGVDIGGYCTLHIYRLDEKGFEEIDQMNYSLLAVEDFYGTEEEEILCVLNDSNTTAPKATMNLYEWQGSFLKRTFQKTYEGVCQGLDYGQVEENRKGLYLAQTSDYTNMNIVLLLPNPYTGFDEQMVSKVIYLNLVGNSNQLISDVNGDGNLNVRSILQPIDASKHDTGDFMQIWKVWDGFADLTNVYGLMENKTDGYRLVIPAQYLDTLTYQFVPESGNSQVRFYDGNSDEPAFIIFAQEGSQAANTERTGAYISLGTSPNGQRHYFAQRYSDTFAGYELTDQLVTEFFQIEGGQ